MSCRRSRPTSWTGAFQEGQRSDPSGLMRDLICQVLPAGKPGDAEVEAEEGESDYLAIL